jgi:predicted nucleic acid-binding protein
VVLEASVSVSVCAKEPTEPKVSAEINRYLANGHDFFAPGVFVAETLYVLCGKLHDGSLSAANHLLAIQDFHTMMTAFVLPPPNGEAALILRAEAIRGGYVCNRSADGLYLALAEELSQTRPTILLTLDKDMPKQAAKNAPTVTVQLLIP